MAKSGALPSDVFDVRKIRRLVELMNEHDLSEIDLRHAEHRIRLRKGMAPHVAVGQPSAFAMSPPPAAAPSREVSVTSSGVTPAEEENVSYVTSPMVGTFYTAANPDAAPFVQVGDRVGPETVVCIVEAMKVFNEIQAECAGAIQAMLVENGDPVEYGQKLFKVVADR